MSSKASVCSCQVFWPNFYKNKIFNFVFIEIVSVAFTFFLFKISTQFPMSRQIFLYLGVVPKWPRNLKNLVVFEHFGTNYLDIVVLLTRAQIWKTSSIQWKVSHNLAAPSSAFLRVEGSLTILILVWPLSQHIILWKSEGLNCLLWKGNLSFFRGGNLWCNDKLKQKVDDVLKVRATLHMIFASHRGAIPKNYHSCRTFRRKIKFT